MQEPDQQRTAFITDQGLYCHKVMPFALKNAKATYQHMLNKMFAKQLGLNMEVYDNNMLVESKKASPHLIDLA